MKPRRHLSVASLSTPALTESLGQSPGRTVAFAHFGDAAQKQWRERRSEVRGRQVEAHTNKFRDATSSASLPGWRDNPDRSFEFTLSPMWPSWSAARSAKEIFVITRDLLAGIAFEGGLKVIHPAFQKVLGQREHPFLEVPMMEFLLQNDGRGRTGKKTARALALYFEACYECGNGSSRWLGWNIFFKPGENRLYCIARDITEAKSAADLSHKMHRMFNVSGDLFCVLDSQGRFQLANPAFQKLLGFPPQHLVCTAFADLVHHRDRPNAATRLGAVAREETVFFVARCGCHPVGHKRIAWRAVAAPPEDLIYCVGRDVTGLRLVGKPSATAEEARVNIAQLANDINNPLEAIVNLLFLLKSGQLPPHQHGRYFDLAEKQVFRIARTLHRIM